jgi:hypothetical protein
MEEEMPDLDKEYPTFLDLFIDAGKYGLDEIPMVFKDRNGDLSDGIERYMAVQYEILFYKYLSEHEGIVLVDPYEGWNTKYLTLNYFMNAIAKSQIKINKMIELDKQAKSFINGELEKRLVGEYSKIVLDNRKRKKTIEEFTIDEMGLFLYFIGDKPNTGHKTKYNAYNFWKKPKNREYKSVKQVLPLIGRFENIIPFIVNPEKKEIAQNELDELKTRYYEETGIKIK